MKGKTFLVAAAALLGLSQAYACEDSAHQEGLSGGGYVVSVQDAPRALPQSALSIAIERKAAFSDDFVPRLAIKPPKIKLPTPAEVRF